MNIQVSLHWLDQQLPVGQLQVFTTRGQERYQFSYDPDWVSHPLGYDIDPSLPLAANMPYYGNKLWGVFQDISPDRWGRMVMDRSAGRYLSPSEYMLGVSDAMRLGALRLSLDKAPEQFLAAHQDIPKLVHLRVLQQAAQHIEQGKETPVDLAMLAYPGSSLGGAHPKAVIEDQGVLWVAKFQSHTDTERVSLWEAVQHHLAQQAGIQGANFRVLGAERERPVFLSRRFDRIGATARLPFISAMTLLERDGTSHDGASYLELADAISRYSSQPQQDKQELWTRMTFNALAGNTDDHLRNHGFLRDSQGWHLSPAYDLNPTPENYQRRTHALSFDSQHIRPSLALCQELAPYFDVDEPQQQMILKRIGKALAQWSDTCRHYGLSTTEIQRYAPAFEHPDSQTVQALAQTQPSTVFHSPSR